MHNAFALKATQNSATKYVELLRVTTTMTGEVIGNVIDLCPVGAITSKPYAFTSRP